MEFVAWCGLLFSICVFLLLVVTAISRVVS